MKQKFKKLRFSKKAIDYSLVMLFIVIVTIPILYWRMTSKIEETKKTIGEDQATLLGATYDKEDLTNYLEKAVQITMPEVLKEVSKTNGYLTQACGGNIDSGGITCSVVNTATSICRPNIIETFNTHFNKQLDEYIKKFNDKSSTKIPTNNYEAYIEGNNINAIAIIPVQKSITKPEMELQPIGTIWFSPSFTVQYEHKLEQYNIIFDALAIILQKCYKSADPGKCVKDNSQLTSGWTTTTTGDNYIFDMPIGPNKACYVLNLPAA